MSREIAPTNDKSEHHLTNIGNIGGDSLAQYRMPSGPSDNATPRISAMLGDHLVIPPLAGFDSSGGKRHPLVADAADTQRAKGAPAVEAAGKPTAAAGQDHTVKHNDSLWKIAEQSLGGKDHASAGQIWHQVQNIVQANRNEHPELLKNPNMIHDGMKLHVPHPDSPQAQPQGDGASHPGAAQPGDAAGHQGAPPAHAGQDHQHHHHHKKHHHGYTGQGVEGGTQPTSANPGGDVRSGQPNKESSPATQQNPSDRIGATEQPGDGGRFSHAIQDLGHGLANIASNVANQLRTIGDCAHGPRLAFGKLGFHMPPAVATEQGKMVRNSGLFDEVPRNQVRPGDYGVRDWSPAVTRAHGGVNKGDAFIVQSVGAHGQLYGANDHHFAVPEDGGRYRNLKFYRPNAEFIKRYGGAQV